MMPAELRPLANHLWQSSLAAVAAGLLAGPVKILLTLEDVKEAEEILRQRGKKEPR